MESLELDQKWTNGVRRVVAWLGLVQRALGELQRERPLLARMKTCQISAILSKFC